MLGWVLLKQGSKRVGLLEWLQRHKKLLSRFLAGSMHYESLVRYILGIAKDANERAEVINLLKEINPEKENIIMTAEALIARGEELGIKKGLQQGLQQAVLGMHKAGADLKLIRKGTGISEVELKEMLQSES